MLSSTATHTWSRGSRQSANDTSPHFAVPESESDHAGSTDAEGVDIESPFARDLQDAAEYRPHTRTERGQWMLIEFGPHGRDHSQVAGVASGERRCRDAHTHRALRHPPELGKDG